MSRALLLLVLGVFACTGPIPERSPEEPAETSSAATEPAKDAGAPPVVAPISCTDKRGVAGDTTITLTSGGRPREAILHAPPSYVATRPLALVLVLHPLLLDHEKMREIVRVERFSDQGEGFLALFPNGIDHSWNAGECCGTAKDEKVDDVAFIQELLAEVSRTHCVDSARIYAMGFSNGAVLSHRLACDLGDTIRAIVPVAGTLGIPEADCKRRTPLPVFAIHGTDDQLVPYEGGPPKALHGIFESFGTFQAPTATDAFWAQHNHCFTSSVPDFTRGEVSCRRHECAAPVTLCTVEGGGHQWPGGDSFLLRATMGHSTDDIDATAAAVTFFRQQGL